MYLLNGNHLASLIPSSSSPADHGYAIGDIAIAHSPLVDRLRRACRKVGHGPWAVRQLVLKPTSYLQQVHFEIDGATQKRRDGLLENGSYEPLCAVLCPSSSETSLAVE